MAKYALPCIACGRQLANVESDATNQPYAGTTFVTHGHYGSTIFDSFEGFYLEINVCDLCLVHHQDRVLQGRDSRPVMEEGSIVGREPIVPPWRLIPWRVTTEEFDWVNENARKEFGLVPEDEDGEHDG